MSLSDGYRAILVGLGSMSPWNKEVTWYERHRLEDSGIFDASPTQISFHHPLARFGEAILGFLCMDGELGEHKEGQNGQATGNHNVAK